MMAAPRAHAILSSSSAHRWMNCPGSVKLSQQFPSSSSVYADEGTLAHEAAEQLIKTGKVDKKHLAKIGAFYEEHPELDGNAEQMVKTLEPYAEYIMEEFNVQRHEDPATQLLTEQRVDLSAWIPAGFGTSDVVIIREGRLHIIDLKYGKGVPVFAEGNPQLRLYALGSLYMLDMVYDVNEVVMTIYQPRLDNVSTDSISAAELYAWGRDVVKPAAEMSLSEDAPFAAGSWCQFCPARHSCRARADAHAGLAAYMKKALLSVEEIGELLGMVDSLVKWAGDLKEGALTRALEGEVFPGWKVVEGRSNRKYSGTEDEIARQCEGAGYDHALLYETKLLTVSAMEKMMGKKQFEAVLGSFIEKPPGKPTLVPESDKRPAIVNNTAAEDFADEFDELPAN